MKIVTVSEMRRLEATAMKRDADNRVDGISGADMMNVAGRGAAHCIMQWIEGWPASQRQRFVVLAGKGNNGGDAWVAARVLDQTFAMDVTLYSVCDIDDLTGDAKYHADIANHVVDARDGVDELPPEALEAVGSNIAVLKSPTVFRLTEGQFYGFEGCQCDAGSCEGSCTHVWNYAMALPFLFPSLERSMRELDYTYNQREDGGMPFRLQLPLGRERSSFRPCVDGQMGGVIKTYREWKISGDDGFIKKHYDGLKRITN